MQATATVGSGLALSALLAVAETAVSAGRCDRVDPRRFLVGTLDGELVAAVGVRCGSPNQCSYCARRAATENAKMLELDGGRGPSPEVWAVLTTGEDTLAMERFYKSREQVIRAVRRRWPAEYACLLEYTTGRSRRSGGRRFPHWNLRLKGVGAGDLAEFGTITRRVWCQRTGAVPEAQHVAAVHEVGGLSRYLALHFQKESQKPPEGFRGLRFITSRGYFNGGLTREQARELAQDALRQDAVRKDGKDAGLKGAELDQWVREELERRARVDWTMIQLGQDRWGEATVTVIGGEPLMIDRGER